MKHLYLLLLIATTAQAQNDTIIQRRDTITFTPTLPGQRTLRPFVTGIHAGPNWSYFTGADKAYNGFNNGKIGIRTGFFAKVPLSQHWMIQTELNYISLGAKNPVEDWKFSTYHISLPVSIGYQLNDFNISAGITPRYMVYARNSRFQGDGFGWGTQFWDYAHRFGLDGTWGLSYNLYGMYLELHGIVGLRKVQRVDYGDKKLGRDAALSLGLYLPFETFK